MMTKRNLKVQKAGGIFLISLGVLIALFLVPKGYHTFSKSIDRAEKIRAAGIKLTNDKRNKKLINRKYNDLVCDALNDRVKLRKNQLDVMLLLIGLTVVFSVFSGIMFLKINKLERKVQMESPD
jgi:hypothetical protein